MTPEQIENLRQTALRLAFLLQAPLPGNAAWDAAVRIAIGTIADYQIE